LNYRDIQSNQSSGTISTPADKSSPSAGNDAKTNYVLLDGHHLIVVAEGKVVLDYLFGVSKDTDPPPKSSGSQTKLIKMSAAANETPPTTSNDQTPSNATENDSGSTMGPVKKSVGPLTISNVMAVQSGLNKEQCY